MHLNSVRPKHRLPKKKREKLVGRSISNSEAVLGIPGVSLRKLTGNFGETDGLNELNGIDEERVSNENRFRGSDHRDARGSADAAPVQGENEEQEVIEVRKLPDVSMPCAAEINQHNLTHLPFRDWCPYCVQGKAVTYPNASYFIRLYGVETP